MIVLCSCIWVLQLYYIIIINTFKYTSNGFHTENKCSFHYIAYAHHSTHLLLTVINLGVYSSVIAADTGKYRAKSNYFGKKIYCEVYSAYLFAPECLFQQAFNLKIAQVLAIDHSTAAMLLRLHSYYKVSKINTLYRQHMWPSQRKPA